MVANHINGMVLRMIIHSGDAYDPTNSKYSYPCNNNIIDKFDLILTVPVTRSGSYFSEYNYYYNKPLLSLVEIEQIPEQVIPAHEEIKFVEC